MPTLLFKEGQNLNFAIAPTVLRQFLASAWDATPQPMPQPKAKAPAPTQTKDGGYKEDLIFVRKDESYEIYLDVNSITRNEGSPFVSFRTVWYPSEEMKERMSADPNFHLLPGKELGRAVLFYEVDFSDGTFMHLRTVNFCTDGSIARDWRWPSDKLKWERPAKGSRIESLMGVLRKHSVGTVPKAQTPKRPSKSKGSGIPLPDEKGFLVHRWGCSVESIRRYVAAPLQRVGDSKRLWSTFKAFKAFKKKIDTVVVYEFERDRLCKVIFYPDNGHVETIKRELTALYGKPEYESDERDAWGWSTKTIAVVAMLDARTGATSVHFIYRPLWSK